jgi:predicted dehydrogenase
MTDRRFDADFLTLQRLIKEKTFGQILSFETHFDRYKAPGAKKDSWKSQAVVGHGILFDLGSHLLDQALTLFGLPDRVFGSVRDERGNSTNPTVQWGEDGFFDDAFDAMLFYDKAGLVVKLVANATSLVERQIRYVVRGTEAGYVKHGLDLQEDQTKAGMRPEDARFGVETEEHWGVLTTPEGSKKVKSEDGQYVKFFENVAAALEGKEEVEVKPEQAANVVRILTLIGQSSRERKALEVAKQ